MGFGVGFSFSLSVFFILFREDSVEAGGRIGDLWSFDLFLIGDLVTGCFIGRVVGVIAVFSSLSVYPNLVWVWADDSSLSSERSNDLVDASVDLVVSREALILSMKFSHSPGSSWINALTIVSCLLIGSGPIRPPVRPSKGQSGVLQAIDHCVTGSMTAQPPGFRPNALRVTTHSQQVASLGRGSKPSAVDVFSSPSRQGKVVEGVGHVLLKQNSNKCLQK